MVEIPKADVEVDRRELLGGRKRRALVTCTPAFKKEKTIAKRVRALTSRLSCLVCC